MRKGKSSMEYAKIPEKNAVLLIRALGLLLSQAGIYGPSHKVTQNAARSVFAELEEIIRQYGAVEIALKDNRVLLNGSIDGLDTMSGKNLVDRMGLHQVGGIVFLPSLDLSEFLTCVSLFGRPPAMLAAQGGFEEVLKQSMLRNVRVVSVAYKRVTDQEEGGAAGQQQASGMTSEASGKEGAGPGNEAASLQDLTAAWERDFESSLLNATGPDSELEHTPQTIRHERATALASLLRETATLLDRSGFLSDVEQHRKIIGALTRIRDTLIASTQESERQIATLADQVDDDRQTIASIESAAKRRGIGLKISRAELIERYAELNQEIVQPLTVSSGVIDLLNTGKSGPLTDSQRDLLKLAADSVARVNQLVAYMNRVAGLPESFTPNAAIISDTYR